MKRFLIVVVHRNGAALLRETVTAALAAMRDDDHLVVVDDGSTDDSLIVLAREFPTVTVIANGCNAGYARACNQGLNTMPSDYVLFLNNDAQLPPNALDRFAEDFVRDPALALIGAQLVAPDGSLQRSFAPAPTWHSELGLRRRKRVTPTPDTNGLLPVETIVGACIAARRTAIDAVGPMDPDFFFYFEETEWCVRMRRHGWKIALDPVVSVTHRKGHSTQAVRTEAQIEALRSRLLYYRKTMPPLLAATVTINRVVRVVLNTLGQLTLFAVTLGCVPRIRKRLIGYGSQLVWLLLGCPRTWGLPDKCTHS